MHDLYFSANSERVPSVTTVISQNLGWNKSALMDWANKCGLDGKRHRDVAAAAARAGTLCHAMIDCHIKGRCCSTAGYDSEVIEKAQRGFENFLSWSSTVDLTPLVTEKPMVSEKHRYGGKPDFIGTVNGELSLVDWKTSDDVYPDMLIQVAAYGGLWNENHPEKPLTGGFHLLCVSKESASFSHHHFETLPQAFEAFLHLLALHPLQAALKGLK
jgi:hypothetical protein